jgi:hypothetical protein
MSRLRIVPLSAAAVLALSPAYALAGAAAPAASKGPVVLAKHLGNPRQLTITPDGTLLAALAGTGRWHATHKGQCVSSPEGGTSCIGDTGGIEQVTAVATAAAGAGARVQSGIFSIADKGGKNDPPGSAATGLDAVSVAPNGTEWGIVTAAPKGKLGGEPRWVKNEVGHLVQISNGVIYPRANVQSFSEAHPNKGHPRDTDPYGVLALDDRVFVADAANNTVLVYRNGKLKTLHVFPYRHGSGKDGSFDTVPTSLATDGKHLYVGTLASFIPNQAKVYELTFAGKIVRTIKHLSQVTSIAVTSGGTVLATEIFGGKQAPFDNSGKPNGLLVSIHTNGKRYHWRVPLPGGVAARGGHVYLSVFSIGPTQGQIWRFR